MKVRIKTVQPGNIASFLPKVGARELEMDYGRPLGRKIGLTKKAGALALGRMGTYTHGSR